MTEAVHAVAGRPIPRRPFALRSLLWVFGAALLAASAALLWRTLVTPPPYRYEPVPAATAGAMQQVKLIGADGSVLAEADVASSDQGPVLLGWRAQVDDPLLHLAVPAEETKALAAVVARHRQPGMPVLAWWDNSRQLRHWGVGEVRFDRHLARPLFVPERWRGQHEQVARIERAFWGQPDAGQLAAFETFTRALVSSEDEGVKLLRSLAPDGRAIVVLHLRDLLLLGELYPKLIGVAFQDFADSGDVHRSVRGVHGWLRESANTAYAVTKLPGNLLRTIALKDQASADTLIARALPLIGNTQDDVRGLTLVHRFGGYAVFELSAADTP